MDYATPEHAQIAAAVGCSRCGALAGDPCTVAADGPANGRPLAIVHLTRMHAHKAAQAAQTN